MTFFPRSSGLVRSFPRRSREWDRSPGLATWVSVLVRGCLVVTPFFLLTALLMGCGPDPVARIKTERVGDSSTLTLEQALEKYPFFSKVTWSTYPGQQGRKMARATGIFDLDSLAGKAGNGRIFSGKDRMVLAKASVNLCYVLEYAYDKDAPKGVRTQMAMTISSMDWDTTAQLENEAVLAEIAQGVAGEATIKVVLDAADYCRSRPASSPKRQ